MRINVLLLAFALCLSAGLATTATAAATAAATPQDAAPRVQLLIPLYSYPTWYNPPTVGHQARRVAKRSAVACMHVLCGPLTVTQAIC